MGNLKKDMKYILLISLLLLSYKNVTLSNKKNQNNKQRKLNENELLSERLEENEEKISVEKIKNEIKDLHNNVKLCIDDHFSKDPDQIVSYNEIIEDCTGENYSIIINFYNSVNLQVKEITKEKIKNKLEDNFCDEIIDQCITFFKTMELFIDKDYDLIKSFEF